MQTHFSVDVACVPHVRVGLISVPAYLLQHIYSAYLCVMFH